MLRERRREAMRMSLTEFLNYLLAHESSAKLAVQLAEAHTLRASR
jgi:hypothetical protein